MKAKKSFLSLLLVLAMLCSLMVAPVSAAGAPKLTITPSVTEIDKGTGTANVVYTIKLDPNGNSVAAFEFQLTAPEGMTLSTTNTDDQNGAGYWTNASELQYVNFAGFKNNPFSTFEYAPTTGYFGASGGVAGRTLDTEKVVMTIQATVDISVAKTYTLGVTKFQCGGVGGVGQGGETTVETVTISGGTPSTPTAVTSASFTMTGYEVGKKITDIAVSTSTTGIAALGGYGVSYTIYKDASRTTPVAVGSTETFAAGTDYWLVLKPSAADGYVINSLGQDDAKLNGKAAIDRGSDFFIFKLDQLSAPAAESYTVSFDANGGTGTMAPVTVSKAATGDTRWSAPACNFAAPTGKAFRVWQVGSDATALCPVGGRITLTGDTTLKALWGTPLEAANFTLSGYEIGSSVKSATLTMDATTAAALKPVTHGATYAIGTGYDEATGLQGEIKDDSAKFEAGKTYYLVVIMFAKDDHSLNGLTKEAVKLDSKAAEYLNMYGDGGYVGNAYFKLDPLTAPTHTHSYTLETVKADALKSAADCQHKAVYYKSCSCGAVSTNAADTFESGDFDSTKHVGTPSTTWTTDGTYHWHVYSGCNHVVDKAAHSYTVETVKADALKSAATCMSKAVYYKSCVCGAVSTNAADTFESGEKNPANHADGCVEDTTAWQKDGTHHWHVYTKCGAVVAASKAEHSYTAGVCVCGATHKDTQTINVDETLTATYHDVGVKINATAKTTLSFAVKSGDAVTVDATTGALDIKKAGTAVVTVTAVETAEYNSDTKDVTVTINPKALTIVSAVAKSRDYQQGVKTVEMLTVQFYGESFASTLLEAKGEMDDDKAGMDKTVHVTVTLKGDAANNYTLADNTFDTKVTINKVSPTAPSNLTGKTGNKLSTVSLPEGWDWVDGETVMSEAGEKQFAAKYVDTTGNYNDVASKDLTVVVSDKDTQTLHVPATINATYGDTNVSVAPTGAHGTVTYTETSDVVDVDASGNVTILKAGNATVTVTAAGDADYASASKTVTINVSKKSLTVTAKNQSIYVNGTVPVLTAADAYTVDGLVTGDAAPTVTLAYSATPDVTKTGSYDIIVTATADTDKYELTAVNGTLTISNRPSSSGKTYAITVESAEHGTVKADRKNAGAGTKINVTVAADKGYTLETLTVLDKNGKEVKLTAKDGKYSFTMPASKVTVKATFAEDNSMLNFFVDVPADEYYADPVLWAAENGITGGVDATHFAPDMTCTRAQAVTFLWRAAGCPAPKSTEMPFADVVSGSYYYDAVLWAVENGITKGTSETTFSPDADCSRAQIVTFLWRSQKSPAASAANPFADVSADAYYANAVLWAVKNGVTTGTAADAFSPDANCTRAQIVTFIYRCMK